MLNRLLLSLAGYSLRLTTGSVFNFPIEDLYPISLGVGCYGSSHTCEVQNFMLWARAHVAKGKRQDRQSVPHGDRETLYLQMHGNEQLPRA